MEKKVINQIKRKLTDAKAVVTKADKERSLIILYESNYNNKIHTFISKNNFTQLTQDITTIYNAELEQSLINAIISFLKIRSISTSTLTHPFQR